MERVFQIVIFYFKFDVVFLLGDLFDEGMISNDEVNFYFIIVRILLYLSFIVDK